MKYHHFSRFYRDVFSKNELYSLMCAKNGVFRGSLIFFSYVALKVSPELVETHRTELCSTWKHTAQRCLFPHTRETHVAVLWFCLRRKDHFVA
jgi:hypothetical protein